MISKLQKKLVKIKKRLDGKSLRVPKTPPQKRDRNDWERIRNILIRRYNVD